MKHFKEYAVLLVVIIGIGLYLALRSSDGVQYELPSLESVPTKEVDAVSIRSGEGSLSLRRANGTWSIPDKGYEANGDEVHKMLRRAADPEITALVSESGDYSRYHLDQKRRIRVRLLRDGEVVRELYLGKSAGQVQNTYVRLPEDQNVYMAEKDLRGSFDVTAADLRDKTVFRLDPEKARGVRISGKNASSRFQRRAASNKDANRTEPGVWMTGQGQAVQTEPMESLLRTLKDLRCRNYKQGLSRNGTKYTIAVRANATHRLRLFVPEKKRPGAYEAESSQTPDPFELPGYLGQELISSVEKLLREPTGEAGSR